MIRGRKHPVISTNVDVQISLHNRFDIEVRNASTGELRQKARGFNVVLDQYYNGRTEKAFSQIWYGSGTGTPAETDTNLFTYRGKKGVSDDGFSMNNMTGIAWWRAKVVFSETEAVGVSFSEVGLGGSNKLYTHAMLQDMNGNPITIQKTNTDIITIYATVYAHWNTDGYDDGKIILTRDNRRYVYSNTSPIAPLQILSGAVLPQVCTASGRFNTTQQNTEGGLTYMTGTVNNFGFRLWLYGEYPIVGEAVGTGDGVTQDFALDFDLPENAKVYVDGVEQTEGVTVYPAIVGTVTRHFIPVAVGSTPTNLIPSADSQCANGNYGATIPEVWLYNPYYSLGLLDIGQASGSTFYISDDLSNWYSLGGGQTAKIYTIPQAHRYDRFFRLTNYLGGYLYGGTIASGNHNGKAIHFDTPPASGAVITADYTTPCAPKDVNHVLDWSVSITLGRYEGET